MSNKAELSTISKQEYDWMVKQASPNSHIISDCVKAFVVGGLICVLGQFIINMLEKAGVSSDNAGILNSVILIALTALLTGIGIFDKIAKFAGAGTFVPITGFANSVAAPSVEFKHEGYVLGVGAKMFLIAGPVIVYGTISSVIVGVFYYLFNKM